MKRILITVLLAVMSMSASAAKKENVGICHFDLDYGVWKLISISGKAVNKHFTNHDDGLPGGETLGTTTLLDDRCEPQPADTLECPCWDDLTRLELLNYINGWIEDNQSGSCNISELSNSYSLGYDYDSDNKYDNHTIRSFNSGTKCQLSDKDLSFDLILDVTEEEHQQCFNEIFDLEPDIVICQNLR